MDDYLKQAVEAARARIGEGIWGHSRGETYFIFCVGQDPVRIAAFISWAFHQQVNIKPLLGKYEGKTERSFIANYRNFKDIEPFLKNEESILVIDRYDVRDIPRARLVYQNGKEVPLGRLYAVEKETAMQCSSWTYDPLTETYFVTGE